MLLVSLRNRNLYTEFIISDNFTLEAFHFISFKLQLYTSVTENMVTCFAIGKEKKSWSGCTRVLGAW